MTPRIALPLVTSISLFVALGWSSTQARRQLRALAVERDSAIATGSRGIAILRDSLLGTGDRLPAVVLRTPEADSVALPDLPSRFRYLYFYRNDCAPCDILSDVWTSMPQARRDSIAFIAYHATERLTPDQGLGHFAWTPRRDSSRVGVFGVPTFVVRGADGRVVAAAHASIYRVANALDYFGFARRVDVDSAIALYYASEAVKRRAR